MRKPSVNRWSTLPLFVRRERHENQREGHPSEGTWIRTRYWSDCWPPFLMTFGSSTEGTAREDIREYEAMDAIDGHSDSPGPQKCISNLIVSNDYLGIMWFLNSGWGLDTLHYWCPWRGTRRRHLRQVRRIWRDQELTSKSGPKNRISQGIQTFEATARFISDSDWRTLSSMVCLLSVIWSGLPLIDKFCIQQIGLCFGWVRKLQVGQRRARSPQRVWHSRANHSRQLVFR